MEERRNDKDHVRPSTDEMRASILPVTPVAIEELEEILYPEVPKDPDPNNGKSFKKSSHRIPLRPPYLRYLYDQLNEQNSSTHFDSRNDKDFTANITTDQVPTGQAPTGQAPTGQVPTGQALTGQEPTQYISHRSEKRNASDIPLGMVWGNDCSNSEITFHENTSQELHEQQFTSTNSNNQYYSKRWYHASVNGGYMRPRIDDFDRPPQTLRDNSMIGPTGPIGPTNNPVYGMDDTSITHQRRILFDNHTYHGLLTTRNKEPKGGLTGDSMPYSQDRSRVLYQKQNDSDIRPRNDEGVEIFHIFVNECCDNVGSDIEPDVKYMKMVSRHDMYERYKIWCSDRGYQSAGGNIFVELADEIFPKYRHKKKWYYIGVRLR